jgi:hypothetical protein
VSGPGVAIRKRRAASASSRPPARTADRTGRRRTRSTIAPQIRPSPSSRRSRPRSGTRNRSTLSPSFERTAGRTVNEPSSDGHDRRRKPNKVASPEEHPDMATSTVSPEMSTDRPDVAAAASSAACSLRPLARPAPRRRTSRGRPRQLARSNHRADGFLHRKPLAPAQARPAVQDGDAQQERDPAATSARTRRSG